VKQETAVLVSMRCLYLPLATEKPLLKCKQKKKMRCHIVEKHL